MSVKKQCYSCKHYSHGACLRDGSLMCGEEMKYWELSDDAKADVLHDAAPEHDAVSHPSHYTSGGIECIDCIKSTLGENFKEELLRALMYDRQQYKKGFKDGMQAALKKIASSLKPRDPEICLLYAMQWEDDGCCNDCVECVKKHLDYMAGGDDE